MITTTLTYTCDLCGDSVSVIREECPGSLSVQDNLPTNWKTQWAGPNRSYTACSKCLEPYKIEEKRIREIRSLIFSPIHEENRKKLEEAHKVAPALPVNPLVALINKEKEAKQQSKAVDVMDALRASVEAAKVKQARPADE